MGGNLEKIGELCRYEALPERSLSCDCRSKEEFWLRTACGTGGSRKKKSPGTGLVKIIHAGAPLPEENS